MPEIRVGDIDIYYRIAGDGPRLFFIGGTAGDLRRSPNIFDSPLTQYFQILSLDQRGMGQTSKPDITYSMQGYAADAEGLLDALGWKTCMLMGYSFGGMVAQELALRAPHRFNKLVLSATSSGGAGGASFPLHTIQDLDLEDRAKMMIRLGDRRRDDAWAKANKRMYEIMVEQTAAILSFSKDQPNFQVGVRRQLEARKDHNTYDRLPMLPMPTLVVGGEHDDLAPAAVLRQLAERIPNVQLQLFNGGHLFHLQDARAWKAIASFLGAASE